MTLITLKGKEYVSVDIDFSEDNRIRNRYLVNLNNANVFEVMNDGFDVGGKMCYWLREPKLPSVIRDYNELLENFSAIVEVKK